MPHGGRRRERDLPPAPPPVSAPPPPPPPPPAQQPGTPSPTSSPAPSPSNLDEDAFDILGYRVKDRAAYRKWKGSEAQADLHRRVSEAGGWGAYLWPERGEELEWYGNDSYYQSLRWISKQDTVLENHHSSAIKAFNEIDKDIPRTCPGHLKESKVCDVTTRILRAYALRNRSIGYCQGMNYITALLSRATNEERAFWLLAVVVELVVPDYYYGLHGVLVDLRLLEAMLQSFEERLWQHLCDVGFNCSALFTQYLICLFSYGVPGETTLQLWHKILHSPVPRATLLRLTCSLMCLLKSSLLTSTEVHEVVEIFSAGASSLYDSDRLIAVEQLMEGQITDEWIVNMRETVKDSLESTASCMQAHHRDSFGFAPGREKLSKELIACIRREWKGSLEASITKDEFVGLMKAVGIGIEDGNVGALCQKWDGSGAYPFKELLLGLVLLLDGGLDDRLRAVIEVINAAQDSSSSSSPILEQIDRSTFDTLLRCALGSSPAKGEDVFQQLDTDGDGKLDFNELSQAVMALPEMSLALSGGGSLEGEVIPLWTPPSMPPHTVADDDATECHVCQKSFRWYRRRHHCRACGKVVCDPCSPAREALPHIGYPKPVRVCKLCRNSNPGDVELLPAEFEMVEASPPVPVTSSPERLRGSPPSSSSLPSPSPQTAHWSQKPRSRTVLADNEIPDDSPCGWT